MTRDLDNTSFALRMRSRRAIHAWPKDEKLVIDIEGTDAGVPWAEPGRFIGAMNKIIGIDPGVLPGVSVTSTAITQAGLEEAARRLKDDYGHTWPELRSWQEQAKLSQLYVIDDPYAVALPIPPPEVSIIDHRRERKRERETLCILASLVRSAIG